MKKVILAGGTGFIGAYLHMRFNELGYKVILVSRDKNNVPWELEALTNAIEGAYLVVNLAGKSINCRHNEANKQAILTSRIDTTKMLGEAIAACTNAPKLWINASATGIYKPSVTHPMTEDEKELGSDFLSEVVSEWERVFFGFKLPATRQIALRTSVVLGKNGGALQPLAQITRLGLGGKQAEGSQMFSWIHLEDYFRAVLYLLNNDVVNGVINCTAPNPVTNYEFMNALRTTLHVPFGLPAPRFAINIGAKLMGTEPSLLLDSSYVFPKKLTDAGFEFTFPEIHKALFDLLR